MPPREGHVETVRVDCGRKAWGRRGVVTVRVVAQRQVAEGLQRARPRRNASPPCGIAQGLVGTDRQRAGILEMKVPPVYVLLPVNSTTPAPETMTVGRSPPGLPRCCHSGGQRWSPK